MQNKKLYLGLTLAVLSAAIVGGSVLAANTTTQTTTTTAPSSRGQGMQGSQGGQQPSQAMQGNTISQPSAAISNSGVSGTIASISDNTITLKSNDAYSTTIDASNVDITNLAVGDFITVKGNVKVIAAKITNGRAMGQEDVQPVEDSSATETSKTKRTVGTVTVIDGTTITIKSAQNDSNTYTVDASGAAITKVSEDGTNKIEILKVSDIKVGDTLFIQGEVSDSTITATAISITSANGQSTKEIKKDNNGIWSRITSFFGKIFGK